MPSQYNGLPANVSPPGTLNIAGSTNATPIELTTTTPHGISPGDSVHVIGHELNTGANGIHSVTVTGLSSFTLDGTAGTAVGLATGTVQNLVMGATIPIPSDGDDFNGAALGVGNIGIADRTAALGLWTGAAKLANRVVLKYADLGGTYWAHQGSNTVAGVPQPFISDLPFSVVGLPGGTFNVLSLTIPIKIGGLAAGDVIHAKWQGTDVSAAAMPSNISLLYLLYGTIAATGITPAFPADYHPMSNAAIVSYPTMASPCPFATEGYYPMGASPGTLWIIPSRLTVGSLAGVYSTLAFDSTLIVEIWRPTGMPQ